jgi:diguanylate cyclase (GGDEF)-like protein/PAS domain S-box-containing protein
VDRELFILKFNKGAESQFEYSQEEIVGKPLHVLFDVKKVSSLIRRLNESGNLINEEISMKTKAGKVRQLILNISAMNYDNPKLNGFVITAKDITEKKKLEKELRKKNEQLGLLAITDSLTDLYNVRHFYSQIKRELKRYHRNPDGQLSLILIDIDFFKALNDAKGHQMGDKVLHSLAQVINACIRQDVDSGFRYGGDEFVVLLPDTKKKQAGVVANRIQKQYRALKFGRTDLSIGITEAEVGDNEETIVKRADDAMYSSKREGGGTISTT